MAIGDIQNFAYTGAVQQTTLLAGKKYKVELWGAQGGGSLGGKGGYVRAYLQFDVDTILNIYVGQHPTTGTGGFNGGGNGDGGGGGATDIRIGGTALSDRKLVAAGGGGGSSRSANGGAGGGLIGLSGEQYTDHAPGQGATQSAGGSLNGTLGQGGNGDGGGGGGGYYGGGGAEYYSGGGGGSSFSAYDSDVTRSGQREGNGYATITEVDTNPTRLTEPTTYSFLNNDIRTLFLAKGKYRLECYGGGGGGDITPGKGGYCAGDIVLESNTYLHLTTGGKGALGVGGWNGGGSGSPNGHGGGGGTDIRIGGYKVSDRIIVAGGGGGNGLDQKDYIDGTRGHGGGLEGVKGHDSAYTVGGSPGTQTTGYALWKGSSEMPGSYIGGGGGGYWGGYAPTTHSAGGGGGSSFYGTLLNPQTLTGVNSGDGYIIITPIKTGPAYRVVSQIM